MPLALSRAQLSFFIKRWCKNATVLYNNNGLDDYAFKSNNFACVRLVVPSYDPRNGVLTTLLL